MRVKLGKRLGKRILCVLLAAASISTNADFTTLAAEKDGDIWNKMEVGETENLDVDGEKLYTDNENNGEGEQSSDGQNAENPVISEEDNVGEANLSENPNYKDEDDLVIESEEESLDEQEEIFNAEQEIDEGIVDQEIEEDFTSITILSEDASGQCGDNLTWTLKGGTLTISGTGEMYNYGGLSDKAPWIAYADDMNMLVIEAGVTSIGEYAFSGCSSFIGRLTIPDGVTSIGECAFSGCSGFAGSLKIPESVTSIGRMAFWYCSGFTGNLTIPNSVTDIGASAFMHCSGFTGGLTIGNSVTSIEESVFSGCNGLTGGLMIPNSVKSIGRSAFSSCSGFTGDLTIGNGVTSIGSMAFYLCRGFKGKLTLGDNVTSIGDTAFCSCTFTGDLTIPNSVTSIGTSAFSACSGFTGNLIISDSVTSIGERAFEDCKGFTGNIIIPDSVMSIREYAFSDCGGFTGSLVIPDSVVSIGQYAFNNCSGLNGIIYVPESVISIGVMAFGKIPNSVIYGGTGSYAETYAQENNIAFIPRNSSKSYLVVFQSHGGTLVESQQVEEGSKVAKPADPIREGCSFLGWYLNGELYNFEVPVTDFIILEARWSGLEAAEASGTCGNDLIWMLSNGILRITGIGDMYNYTRNYTAPWISYTDTMNKVVIEPGVTSIGTRAFYGCNVLTGGLTIPDSVRSIGERAFYDCSGFTESLTIGSGVTSIGERAFYGCSGFIGNLTVPDSVTSIGERAFYGCSGFTGHLTISNNVISIEDGVFADCRGLTGSLMIPDNVTNIGYQAFKGCDGLNGEIYIPGSVISIGDMAFAEIPNCNIYGVPGSYAETYAQENNIPFEDYHFDGTENCIVVFQSNGGTQIDDQKVKSGEKVVRPADPVREGYRFRGWYLDEKCTTLWDFELDTVQGNIILYAGWEENNSSEEDPTDQEKRKGIHIIGLEESYEFTGTKIIPNIGVMDYDVDGGKLLVPGVDYTVKYKNNTKVGTAELTVTGKGNYSGKDVSARFTIKEAENAKVPLVSLKGAKIMILEPKLSYDGNAKYPSFTVTLKGGTAKQYKYDKERGVYTADGDPVPANVTLSNNINKGTATIFLKGADNTKIKKTFKITAIDLAQNVAKVEVKAASGIYAVKGAAPASITVTYDGKKLKNGTDYTVKYSSNKKVTTSAKIVITGKGNYAKKCTKTYEIKKLNLNEVKVSAVAAYAGLKAKKVKATVVDGQGNALKSSQYTLRVYKNATDTTPCNPSEVLGTGSKIYVEAVARDTVNLDGATSRDEFDVGNNIAKAKVTNNNGKTITKQYTGFPITFTVENKDELRVTLSGKELIMGNDYEIVSYSNNINKGTATAVIKGIGSYSGTKTFKFKISAKQMQIGGNSSWDDIVNLIKGLMSF